MEGSTRPAGHSHRGDGGRIRIHPAGATTRLPARHQQLDRARVGRRDRRLAPIQREQHRIVRRSRPVRVILRQLPSQGPITKTGNGHVRRLLVEAAWHHQSRYRIGKTMRTGGRWRQRPPATAETRATDACTPGGCSSSPAANGTPSPPSPSPASWPGGAGHSPSSDPANQDTDPDSLADGWWQREERPATLL